MKNTKLLSALAFCFIAAILLSSCGIMKNNDFATKKYTHFRKGESAVTLNQVTKENKTVELRPVVSDEIEIPVASELTEEKPVLANVTTKSEIKNNPDNTINNNKIIPKETKKEKLNRAVSFVNDKLVKKPNTTANSDDALSILWVVILILLILWIIGLASGGFGLGGLINILLVIALILLILWLLRVV